MKKSVFPKMVMIAFLLATFVLTSCGKDDDPAPTANSVSIEGGDGNEEGPKKKDPIVGTWYLKAINDIDVSEIECYKDSYLKSDSKNIIFYILDRQEDGSCKNVLRSKENLTIEDGFYYLGDEVLDITIDKDTLTWYVDLETTLIFQK